jgi:hypothetical protein
LRSFGIAALTGGKTGLARARCAGWENVVVDQLVNLRDQEAGNVDAEIDVGLAGC